MHICFHMFLFVWCRISLVVSVQPVFSIQNSESFTQTILSHLRIFTTNSFVLNAGKSRLGAFCRRRWLQPFPRVFCIKMNFTTDSLDSHQFSLICTSPQQFFHICTFFTTNSFTFSQQFFCATTTDQLRARVVSELSADGADRSHFRVSFSHRNIIQPEDWIGSVINIRRVRIPCKSKRLCIKSLPYSMTKTRRNPI